MATTISYLNLSPKDQDRNTSLIGGGIVDLGVFLHKQLIIEFYRWKAAKTLFKKLQRLYYHHHNNSHSERDTTKYGLPEFYHSYTFLSIASNKTSVHQLLIGLECKHIQD